MTISPKVRRWLAAALVLAAAAFIAYRIVTDLDKLRTFEWTLRPGLLVLSVLLLSAVLLWGVVVWRLVLRTCGLRVPFRALARAWFLSNLSRYIPGVVWQFLTLAQLGPAVGLTPAVTVMSLLVQMGFLLLSAAAVGVSLLPLELAGVLAPFLPVLRWMAPLTLLAVHPRVITAGLRVAGRVTKREMPRWEGSWLGGLGILLLSALSWCLYGGAFYLFLSAFVTLPLSALGAVTAMNALAFIVGYVVVIAPAGAGFKEGALALLLAGLVPSGVGAALAVAARLWTIVGEALPALVLAARKNNSLTQRAQREP
ncbi:MAG TPA: lysylphosphatidylglycerol synthase domain-containing protein [Longimicrobium sp.]